MKEIFGFIVLSSPLFLIVLWLPACIGLGVVVGLKFLKKGKFVVRVTAGILCFLLFLVAPVADEIVGRIYFNQLCEAEAGAKVYQTIELPAEYWNAGGEPKFYVNRYGHDKLRFVLPGKHIIEAPEYKYTWITRPYNLFFHIDKDTLRISDRSHGIVLGEYILFRYWGGWVAKNFSPHNSALSCETKDIDSWSLDIFKTEITSTL